jgi:hypothetical protein
VSALLFKSVLWTVWLLLLVASRLRWRVRAQITRDVVVEISSDDGVAQRFRFHGRSRTLSRAAAGDERVDVALRFATARDGLRALLSPHAVRHIVEGVNYGGTRMEGNTALVLWFYGLTRTVAPIGRTRRPRRKPPIGARAPETSAPWAARIVREPAVRELDRDWDAGWNARAKLLQVRAADGGRLPPG